MGGWRCTHLRSLRDFEIRFGMRAYRPESNGMTNPACPPVGSIITGCHYHAHTPMLAAWMPSQLSTPPQKKVLIYFIATHCVFEMRAQSPPAKRQQQTSTQTLTSHARTRTFINRKSLNAYTHAHTQKQYQYGPIASDTQKKTHTHYHEFTLCHTHIYIFTHSQC